MCLDQKETLEDLNELIWLEEQEITHHEKNLEQLKAKRKKLLDEKKRKKKVLANSVSQS